MYVCMYVCVCVCVCVCVRAPLVTEWLDGSYLFTLGARPMNMKFFAPDIEALQNGLEK
jgi:hypothetical protein